MCIILARIITLTGDGDLTAIGVIIIMIGHIALQIGVGVGTHTTIMDIMEIHIGVVTMETHTMGVIMGMVIMVEEIMPI